VPPKKSGLLANPYEALFSFNLAFAAVNTLMVAAFGLKSYDVPESFSVWFRYLFLRSAIRVNSILRLGSIDRVGREMTFILSTISLAVLVWSMVCFLGSARRHNIGVGPVAGLSSLLAVPMGLLYANAWLWSPPTWNQSLVFCQSANKGILVADILCISALLYFRRKSGLSVWTTTFLFVLHYGWWSWRIAMAWFHIAESTNFYLIGPLLLSAVFPLSGLSWLVYAREIDREDPAMHKVYQVRWGRVLPLLASAIALLGILWLPAPGYSILHPKNIQSLTITMGRGGSMCFHCPNYAIAIHGDGLVEYSGNRYVAVRGLQKIQISADQLAELLKDFDRIHFFSIDDRAFEKCKDGPAVSLSVSVDGRRKGLWNTIRCVDSGPQAELAHVADEVDKTVGSNRWVACNGYCSP
jgi:hypothetical protein